MWSNLNCDKTQKLKLWQNLNYDKAQIVTNLKFWQNSKCEEEKNSIKSKFDKIQIVTKLENSNYDNSKSQLVTKLKKSNCEKKILKYDKSQFLKKKFWPGLLVRTFWHLDNRWDVLWAIS